METTRSHWHGAAPTRLLTHAARLADGSGGPAAWGEHPAGERYGQAPDVTEVRR